MIDFILARILKIKDQIIGQCQNVMTYKNIYNQSEMTKTKILIFLCLQVSLIFSVGQVYYTACADNVGRQCPSSTNRTDFLLSMKKGGTNVLSTSPYLYDFFLCEEYNYDCGYMQTAQSYVTIANGVDLNITATDLADITTLTTTQNKIKPYIGAHGDSAKCGMVLFPLQLTSAESKQVLDGYMTKLQTKIKTAYDADRVTATTDAWNTININIRTAILQKCKANKTMIRNSTMWTKIVQNRYTEISSQLKQYYKQYDQQIDLHAAYLIDSVTQKCNKLQSVNFLVDESGSIGSAGFVLAKQFLQLYVNDTNDDLSIMSIHFYDSSYDEYITYGHNKSYFQTMIPAKPYRAFGTLTGSAINQTIDRIVAANFKKGLPKIMVVMTDGASYDSVLEASHRARSLGIIPLAVGIGANVNDSQLLQIAETASNLIKVSSYADLPKLVQFISNYFCKQIITIGLGQTIQGNYVRVPQSPSYFRVIKSPMTQGQQYELDITFDSDPVVQNQSIFQSQIDPFPDQFTQYKYSEYYQIFNQTVVSNALSGANYQKVSGFIPKKVYFISPQHQVDYIVKKNAQQQMNVTVSYVAVRGNNLGFNVSLKVCTTLNCTVEKKYYDSISSKRKKNDQTVIIMDPQTQDLSIFIIIGSTLAAMACLCTLCILFIRRLKDDEQEKKKLNGQKPLQRASTLEHIDEILMPAQSRKKLSKKSQKSEKASQQQNLH